LYEVPKSSDSAAFKSLAFLKFPLKWYAPLTSFSKICTFPSETSWLNNLDEATADSEIVLR